MTSLPDTAKWAERLQQYRPWLPHAERGTWRPFWGLSPDSSGINPSIPPLMLAEWKNTYRAEMEKARKG